MGKGATLASFSVDSLRQLDDPHCLASVTRTPTVRRQAVVSFLNVGPSADLLTETKDNALGSIEPPLAPAALKHVCLKQADPFFLHRPLRSRRSAMVAFLEGPAGGGSPDGYAREELRPLTQYRQQHRRTKDGYLCSAAGVTRRLVFTGCTDMPAPDGGSGEAWCYVEPELLANPKAPKWGYCAPVVDYQALRNEVVAEAPVEL